MYVVQYRASLVSWLEQDYKSAVAISGPCCGLISLHFPFSVFARRYHMLCLFSLHFPIPTELLEVSIEPLLDLLTRDHGTFAHDVKIAV